MRNLNAVNIVMLQMRVKKGLANKEKNIERALTMIDGCLLYTSPSPRDATLSRMPSSA